MMAVMGWRDRRMGSYSLMGIVLQDEKIHGEWWQ